MAANFNNPPGLQQICCRFSSESKVHSPAFGAAFAFAVEVCKIGVNSELVDNTHWQTKYVRFDRHNFQVSNLDKITVLSVDGGGLRGVIPADVLQVAIKEYKVIIKALGGYLESFDAKVGLRKEDPTVRLQRSAAAVELTMKPKDGTFLYYPGQL